MTIKTKTKTKTKTQQAAEITADLINAAAAGTLTECNDCGSVGFDGGDTCERCHGWDVSTVEFWEIFDPARGGSECGALDCHGVEFTAELGDGGATLTGVRICTQYGGPTVCADTVAGAVVASHGDESATAPLTFEACDELNRYALTLITLEGVRL